MLHIPIISDIVNSIAGVVNTYNLTSEQKEKIKADMNNVVVNYYDKIIDAQKEIISTEAKGNWLQRSWRPIIMLAFASIVIAGIFIDIPLLKDNSPFWDILQLGLGGYVIGRSAEKITTTLGKNLKK